VAAVSGWPGETNGGVSNLFSLFQPQPSMAGLFRFATAFLITNKSKQALSLVRPFWLEIILGAIPGILLGILAWSASGWHVGIVLLCVFVCIACACVMAVLGLLVRLMRMPKSYFGLCTGHTQMNSKVPGLIPWLDGKIHEVADRKPGDPPLTFGDLRKVGITLQMMTTCLTWGRPFTLPFTTRQFYFSPKEFRDFFPEKIVHWMIDHPPTHDGTQEEHDPDRTGKVDIGDLKPLPNEDDLPVIVAARLSLSFPFLFCTVPRYAVDFTLRECKQGEEPAQPPVPGGAIAYGAARVPEHVWFIDGGICNNFPLHLFDAPIPRWPTFGIDLTDLRPDRPKGECRAWLPTRNGGGVQPNWTRLSAKGGLPGTWRLVAAIVNSARNWLNSLQAIVPGFRDRIVHISLSEKEGGLNLTMPPATLDNLSKYGSDAAQLLIDHFINGQDNGKVTPMTWVNQRWIRYRSTMGLIETFLTKFADNIQNPEEGDISYSDLIERQPGAPPPTGYSFKQDQIPFAIDETKRLVEIGTLMKPEHLKKGAPNPEPTLVIRPNF